MKLTDKDIRVIHDFAQQNFINDCPKFHTEHRFLTECVVKSFLHFLSMKKMVIVSEEEYNMSKQLQEEQHDLE